MKGMEVVERGMIMMTGSRITSLYCNEMSRVSEDAEWPINHDDGRSVPGMLSRFSSRIVSLATKPTTAACIHMAWLMLAVLVIWHDAGFIGMDVQLRSP